MFDQFSKQINEFGNSFLDALSQIQGFFGKELDVATPIKNSILDMVGNTPLIRLNHVASHIQGFEYYLKAEFQNPTGSLRDRSAIAMIRDAFARGKLTKNSTILIHGATSSSVSMAWAGRTMGYRVKCFIPESTSQEWQQKLSHYGAELVKVSHDPVSILLRESLQPGTWYPNETANMANPNHHFSRTGPEIYRDLKGKVDCFVTGGGTGATVTGIGRFFKSFRSGVDTKIILAGWKDSLFDQYFNGGRENIRLPEIFDPKVVDRFISVTTDEAMRCQSDLLVQEGIPVGITTGMILCAAIRYGESLASDASENKALPGEKKNLVLLSPDRE